MILLFIICLLVWFIWGAMFDPEESKGRVEKAIRHPGRWSTRVLEGWVKDAEEVLRDPASNDEDREKAMKDIELFTGILKGRGI